MASPDTPQDTGHLINHPGGEGVRSGVNSGQLKTPLHKIAGSAAGNDPTDALENAQGDDGVQLAGASAGDEGVGPNPFRTLASVVIGASDDNEEAGEERPSFDPVQ
jgi:hypothetical protein